MIIVIKEKKFFRINLFYLKVRYSFIFYLFYFILLYIFLFIFAIIFFFFFFFKKNRLYKIFKKCNTIKNNNNKNKLKKLFYIFILNKNFKSFNNIIYNNYILLLINCFYFISFSLFFSFDFFFFPFFFLFFSFSFFVLIFFILSLNMNVDFVFFLLFFLGSFKKNKIIIIKIKINW